MDAKLREQAEKLGITVDSRWSDTTIQQKIDEKQADIKAVGKASIIPNSDESAGKSPSKEALAGAAVDSEGKVLPTEATPKAVHSGVTGLDEKAQIQLRARQLNIMVDDKWDIGRLRGEIQMAREGRADLQIKGAVPPAEYSDLDYDPATKDDKRGITPGVIPLSEASVVKLPGITIAGEPAVALAGPVGGAVPQSAASAGGEAKK